ncbi:DUF1471 domain-containing protein [Salmonella enterica]|nr:DUF1471 domain-containing protein [Salmonella enterica]
MRARIMLFLAALLPGITATAAIELNNHQARNMDDVRNAMYYHVILIREPGSNGNIHASANIYR